MRARDSKGEAMVFTKCEYFEFHTVLCCSCPTLARAQIFAYFLVFVVDGLIVLLLNLLSWCSDYSSPTAGICVCVCVCVCVVELSLSLSCAS